MEPAKAPTQLSQEIATENSVPLAEVLTDIDQWRQALGKWTRTVEALYKLCSSPQDWAALKLEPTEKRVIKKKCEEVFAQIQEQRKAPTVDTAQPAASSVGAASSLLASSVSAPPSHVVVTTTDEGRTTKSVAVPTPGGPDAGLPARIKVPMKGSEASSKHEKKKGGSAVHSQSVVSPSATSALLVSTSPSPQQENKRVHLVPSPSTMPLVAPSPVSSPTPAAQPAARPMGSADLSLAITKIFEIVKQKSAKELRLSGKQLEKSHLKLIFDSLMQTNVVSHVELRQASLGDEGAALIAKFIKSNKYPTLTSIDLAGNPFKPAALEELADAVSKNFSIVSAALEDDPAGTEGGSSKKPVDIGIVSTSAPSVRQRVALVCESNKVFAQAKSGSKELRLPGRSLTDFPDNVCSFSWLTILDLNTNDLTSVSFNIEGLRNLERLILNKNQLETLPAQVGLLPKLIELNLSNNCLTTIPAAIGLLANLEELNVAANRLTELPKSLGGLRKLKSLKCSKNPWKKDMVVPKNVLSKGDEATLAYLRNLFTSGEAYMNRMKLMFVGNGNVGKTSLLASFKKQKPQGPNVATDGIDISEWAPDERITFNAWDFAGQEVYYATHSFFLSPQAIYIIVFNMLDDEHSNKIEYWLRSIHARAGKPPVVLVGTHLDEMSRDAGKIQCDNLQSKWQANFKNIELVTAVSTVNGKGVKELQKELVRIAMKQKWMDKTIPKNYLLVQQKIEALKGTGKAPWLDWSAYRNLILECGVSEDDVAHVTDFLVNLGDIAYCPTASKNPDADKVVLDSQWLTKAFATIITMKANFVKDGLLSVSALQHLWATYPSDISQYLVALFERYELIYKIDEQTLLVPSMLKEQRPAQVELDRARFAYSPESELGRIYQLDFVPTGLFSRIVVRLLSLRWKPNILWRHGEECCVLLELDLREQLLKLHIRGIHIQRNLILFTDGIQSLLREWPKLKYKIFVPCASCNSHRYTLAQLDEAVQAGKRFVVCPSTRAQVRLDAVVPDITMSQLPKIDFCDLNDLQLIGKGSYASVYKCTWKGRQVAVKQVTVPVDMVDQGPMVSWSGASVSSEFRREVWLMSGLKHRNFVQLFGVSQSPLCFVMEYCSKGSLAEYLNTCGKLDWARRLPILEDVAHGMNYLHQHNPPIVHRDLKSPNVLLSQEGNTLVAKVGDVGIAQGLLVASRLSIRGVDCPVWVAPEILGGGFYNEKSDVYSYAIILWEVLTQSAPFGDSLKFFAELEKRIIEGQRPELPADLPPICKDLLQQCWDNDPRKRPSFADVLVMLGKVKETLGGPSTHVDG